MNHKDQTQLGHYKILQKLGAGGMGEVYLAEDTKLEHQIAAISGVTAAGKIHAVRFHTTAHLTTHSTGAESARMSPRSWPLSRPGAAGDAWR